MCRRRADRPHRLPQLRQPREAGDRARAGPGDRGESRRQRRRSGSRSFPGTSRSTTMRTAPRSHRHRSSAASGLVPDVRRVPAGGRAATRSVLASSPEGSLAAETALIRFLWKAAPHLNPLPRRRQRRASKRPLAEAAGVERRPSRPTSSSRTGLRLAGAERQSSPAARSARSASARVASSESGRCGSMCGVFRRVRPRPRRGAADVLRPVRAAAPRAGVGGHRRLRARAADRPARTSGLVSQVFDRAEARRGPPRPGRDRPTTAISTTGSSQWPTRSR
jgi:hypothetical protein